jgi:hypothetical protein
LENVPGEVKNPRMKRLKIEKAENREVETQKAGTTPRRKRNARGVDPGMSQ